MSAHCHRFSFVRRLLCPSLGLFVVLALAATGASAQKPPVTSSVPVISPGQPRYFFTIDLDPRYQIIGQGELTESAAGTANCYRFQYDQKGGLREVEYLRAGDPQPDPLFGVERVDFEHQAGVERRWYRDAQGNPSESIYGNDGEELTLNPAGYPTDVTNLDANGARTRDGSGVVHYVRTLDPAGRIIVGRRVGLLGTFITDDNGYFETRSVYDNLGHRIEYGNYDASGNALNDSDGVALTRTTYTIYPDSTQSIESYFDATGLAASEKSTGVHQTQRTYDARGLLADTAYFDATGAPTIDNDERIHECRYQYDGRGNRLSEQYFDVDGKLRDLKEEGYAKVTYRYDDLNRVIEKAYFGDDGTPQVVADVGAAVVRLEYGDRNLIVREQFFDGQGHPAISAKYGAPAIRIEVNGDTTVVRLRNAADHPAKNAIYGYAAFSYKTDSDTVLSPHNHYYNLRGRTISYFPRVSIINPHLYQLAQNPVMQISARGGAAAVGLGALLGAFLALRKASHTKRRKVYAPKRLERFLTWFALFAIIEGTFRFFLTIYWWWLDHQYVRMGHGAQLIEMAIILWFFYRLLRISMTLRVLNIGRDDILRLIREFFEQSGHHPEWDEATRTYAVPSLRVRVRYFAHKYHAYLSFYRQGSVGRKLARDLKRYIRDQARTVQGPVRSRAIALYYPSVAFCYLLLSATAFYTLWQLVKRY
jgi:hypothetical protein